MKIPFFWLAITGALALLLAAQLKVPAPRGGKTHQKLSGKKAPVKEQILLVGHYHARGKRSPDVAFLPSNRFKRSLVAGQPDAGAPYTLVTRKTVHGGDRAGRYSVKGDALTLRFDNGGVERMRVFFGDKMHNSLWFEGHWLVRDEND